MPERNNAEDTLHLALLQLHLDSHIDTVMDALDGVTEWDERRIEEDTCSRRDIPDVKAEALLEAADAVYAQLGTETGGHTSTYSVRMWLTRWAEDIRRAVKASHREPNSRSDTTPFVLNPGDIASGLYDPFKTAGGAADQEAIDDHPDLPPVRLTITEDKVQVFRDAWNDASRQGLTGGRVKAGLRAIGVAVVPSTVEQLDADIQRLDAHLTSRRLAEALAAEGWVQASENHTNDQVNS